MGHDGAIQDKPGKELPTATGSKIKMQPDVPAAKACLRRLGAEDLSEMILGPNEGKIG